MRLAPATRHRSFWRADAVQAWSESRRAQPLAAEVALLQKDNAHLMRRLARADAIIAVQKKLADLLGIPMAPDGDVP